MPALLTLAFKPEAVFVVQTVSIVLLFCGLPSWLFYRVRSAAWVSLAGAVLFLASCVLFFRHGSQFSLLLSNAKALPYIARFAWMNAAATVLYATFVLGIAGYIQGSRSEAASN